MSTFQLISHALCPYVQRAAIVLAEKGVPFERTTIDLDHKPDWFLALSPLGRVPLLRVRRPGERDAVLFESAAICEYLDEVVPGPRLHPDDPIERAQHRAWMEFGSSVLSDIWGLETATDAGTFDAKRAAIATKFRRLEDTLDGGAWFGGDRFSLVDAVFGPVFRYFDTFDALLDTGVFTAVPKVRAWRRALAARPSVREAVSSTYDEALRAFLAGHDAFIARREYAERVIQN